MLCLSLAGNNEEGHWRDMIDACGVASLHLSGDDVPCLRIGGRQLKLGDGLIVQTHGYIPWHGNMMWDSFQVDAADAARVIEFLRTQHWTCEEGDVELFQAYEDGQPLNVALLEAHS